ncbi:YwpF family protein [Ureibacillus thermophilus]|uniref:YwpF family protein n=1 Tax=Ureibacillus thermophilus TaxID=367743 RepID=UPI0036171E8C
MKTFKMISFQIEQDGVDVPLIDGITINQENKEKTWILELLVDQQYKQHFKNFLDTQEFFDVRVTITSMDNEPAPFTVKVLTIEEIGNRLSILLKGHIRAVRLKYAEQLLQSLLEKNLTKEELLHEFRKGMKERPSLRG